MRCEAGFATEIGVRAGDATERRAFMDVLGLSYRNQIACTILGRVRPHSSPQYATPTEFKLRQDRTNPGGRFQVMNGPRLPRRFRSIFTDRREGPRQRNPADRGIARLPKQV